MTSYPAVLVVPENTSDETLISVASQFQHNRFPVVTWKHPGNQAVLLRAGSFLPSSDQQKFGPIANLPTAVIPGRNKLMGVAGRLAGVGSKAKVNHPQGNGGCGVYNMDVEGYIMDILQLSQTYKRTRQKSSLVNEISGAPKTMHFDLPDRTSSVRGWHGLKRNSRTKSWESDDVDMGMKQGRYRNGDSTERSLTPDPEVERAYASPEHIVGKPQKRRFTISNVIQKVRSPHFARKRRYKAARSTGEIVSSPESTQSPSHGEREGEGEGGGEVAARDILERESSLREGREGEGGEKEELDGREVRREVEHQQKKVRH